VNAALQADVLYYKILLHFKMYIL